ncbi:MAG: hypothetical protein NDJ89_11475 [Oligoflexia bacterium]|nr:hypothetical protein [Oligoflexia bacterium]
MFKNEVFCRLVLMSAVLGTFAAAPASAGVDRNVNIRVSPLSIMSGNLGSDVDFAVSRKFTVGPTVSTLSASLLAVELKGYNIGARGNLYLTGDAMSDGWILGPSIGYSSMRVSLGTEEGTTGKLSLGSLIGYQWIWGTGFNVNAGLGANWLSGDQKVATNQGTDLSIPFYSGIVPSAELTVGYAF